MSGLVATHSEREAIVERCAWPDRIFRTREDELRWVSDEIWAAGQSRYHDLVEAMEWPAVIEIEV